MSKDVKQYEVVDISYKGPFRENSIEISGILVGYEYSAGAKSYESIRFMISQTSCIHEITNIPRECVKFSEKEIECR